MGISRRRRTDRFRGNFRGFAIFVFVCIAVIVCACIWSTARTALPEGTIQLYFVDVGQGDASLVVTPEGSVLIDAGLSASEETLYHTVRKTGNTLSYLIITHPHDDHLGGAVYILERMDVEHIVLPKDTSDIAEYEKFLLAAEEEGAQILYTDASLRFTVGEAEFTCLAPFSDTGDANENSAVIRLDFGRFSALFTGDAGKESEDLQIGRYGSRRGGMLDVDILKVGHHGSDGSSTEEYLAAVTPYYAVISCGEDNSYGHPAPAVLSRLEDAGAVILRTDEDGTVVFTVDAESIRPEK